MKRLYTIGYERTGLSELIRALQDAGVELLVDVRELPNSRRAGFSKRTLAASLADAGIEYRHLRALGTPKEGRQANQSGRMDAFWRIVDEGLARPEAALALAELQALAEGQVCCLLCVETDANLCHRSAVVARLTGFSVQHLQPGPAAR